MIRVCEVAIEGYEQPFKIKSLTCREADEFIVESRQLIAKAADMQPNEWLDRTIRVVSENLVGMDSFDVRAELDLASVQTLYLRILEFSGLRTGEVQAAASPSPKFAAA